MRTLDLASYWIYRLEDIYGNELKDSNEYKKYYLPLKNYIRNKLGKYQEPTLEQRIELEYKVPHIHFDYDFKEIRDNKFPSLFKVIKVTREHFNENKKQSFTRTNKYDDYELSAEQLEEIKKDSTVRILEDIPSSLDFAENYIKINELVKMYGDDKDDWYSRKFEDMNQFLNEVTPNPMSLFIEKVLKSIEEENLHIKAIKEGNLDYSNQFDDVYILTDSHIKSWQDSYNETRDERDQLRKEDDPNDLEMIYKLNNKLKELEDRANENGIDIIPNPKVTIPLTHDHSSEGNVVRVYSDNYLFIRRENVQNNQTEVVKEKNKIEFKGDTWDITFQGRNRTVRDSLGMRTIAYLIKYQGDSFRADKLYKIMATNIYKNVELIDYENLTVDKSNIYPDEFDTTDKVAIEDARELLRKLKNDLENAIQQNADTTEIDGIHSKIKITKSYLNKVSDKYGNPRKIDDFTERARKAIGKNVKTALNRIKDRHPIFHKHLNEYLVAQKYSSYKPNPPIGWTIKLSISTH